MKATFIRTFALTAVALALAACNSFIPDQPLTNAFGLDGVQLELTPTDTAARGLAPQQAQSLRFAGEISAFLDDIDASDVPGWVNPATLRETLGLERELRLTVGLSGGCPSAVTITDAALELSITDPGGTSLAKSFSASGLAFTFERSSQGALECSYQAEVDAVALLTLLLQGSELDTLYNDILANGQQPNEVAGSFALTVSSDEPLPTDATLRVTLSSSEGLMTF